MAVSDLIQLSGLFVALAALLILLWQTYLQNRLLLAQLLRDRFEMYATTYEPVTNEEVEELQVYPDDYMDISKYGERYKDNRDATRKYLSMLYLYEYLAFSYALKRAKLPDPLGYLWTERWVKDLAEETEFLDVHEYQGRYHPEFARLVDSLIGRADQANR